MNKIEKAEHIRRNPDEYGLDVCWKHTVPILFESPPILGGSKPSCPACSHIVRLIYEYEQAERKKEEVLQEMRSLRKGLVQRRKERNEK